MTATGKVVVVVEFDASIGCDTGAALQAETNIGTMSKKSKFRIAFYYSERVPAESISV